MTPTKEAEQIEQQISVLQARQNQLQDKRGK